MSLTINIQHQNVCEQISGDRSLVLDYYHDMDTQTKYGHGSCAEAGFTHQYIGGPGDIYHVKVTNWGQNLPSGSHTEHHHTEHHQTEQHHAAKQHHEDHHEAPAKKEHHPVAKKEYHQASDEPEGPDDVLGLLYGPFCIQFRNKNLKGLDEKKYLSKIEDYMKHHSKKAWDLVPANCENLGFN